MKVFFGWVTRIHVDATSHISHPLPPATLQTGRGWRIKKEQKEKDTREKYTKRKNYDGFRLQEREATGLGRPNGDKLA